MKLVLQWVLGAVALLVAGPVAGWSVSANIGVDGSGHATMLIGQSVTAGVLGHLGALALAAAMGVVSGRLTTGRFGLFCAGVVLAWGAARSGRVEEVLAASIGRGVFGALMVEGVILAAGAAAVAWLACRGTEDERTSEREKAASAETALALAAGVVGCGLVAWVAAQDDVKGQTITAAAVGGIAAGTLARVLAPRSAAWVVVLGAALAGVIGPVLAMQFGAEKMLLGLFADDFGGALARLGRVAPLDWAAGVLMGAPIGMSWASSMVEKREQRDEHGDEYGSEHPAGAAGRREGA